ncbi:MAG: CHAT domain-containing tetratricopeptide repeat protein [Acidobacteriota bacterium]
MNHSLFRRPASTATALLLGWGVLLGVAHHVAASEGGEESRPSLLVEQVPTGGSLDIAGLESGDRILSWKARGRGGPLTSPFDWWVLTHGEALKGPVRIVRARDGILDDIDVTPGDWRLQIQPSWPKELAPLEIEPTAPWCLKRALWERLIGQLGPLRETRPDLVAWARLSRAAAAAHCLPESEGTSADRAALEASAAGLESPSQRAAFWVLHGEALRETERRRGVTLDSLKRAKAEAAAETEPLLLASVRLPLTRELLFHRDLGGAAAEAEAAAPIARTLVPGSLLDLRAVQNLAYIREHQGTAGSLAEAERYYKEGLGILKNLAVQADERARAWRDLGIVQAKQGNLKGAEWSFEQGLEWGKQVPEPNDTTAGLYNNLGLVAYSRMDLDKSFDYLQEALRRKIALNGGQLTGPSTLANLATVQIAREEFKGAEKYLHRALAIQEKIDTTSLGMAILLNTLGRVQRLLGDTVKARGHHERALAIQKNINPNSLSVSESLERLAQVDEAEGLLEEAAARYEQAQTMRESVAPSTTRNAILLSRMADLARKRGLTSAASSIYRRAVRLVEDRLQDLGGSHGQRESFQSVFGQLYRDTIDTLVENGEEIEAFEAQERARAKILREMLAERDLELGEDLPEDLKEERQDLAERYDEVLASLAAMREPAPSMRVLELEEELDAISSRREELVAKVRLSSPRLAALTYPRALDFESIRTSIDPGTLLLAFSVNTERSLLFVLSRGGALDVHRLPTGSGQLRDEIDAFLSLIEESAGPPSRRTRLRSASVRAAGQRLFDQLLAPAAERIEASRRLLILPDGPLHRLPFAALVTDARGAVSSGPRGRLRPYLVEWKPIHLALSFSLFQELRARGSSDGKPRGPASVPLIAFGAPRLPPAEASTPRPEQVSPGRRSDLPELPAARREVQDIGRLFGDGQIYLGRDVSEERVLALPPRVSVLHFATHVRLDPRDPLDSALVLAAPPPREDDLERRWSNGLLQVREIFENLRIEADLVVLSACESALGEEVQGEGLIGLTRAFHFAGARSVVASLWPVDDRATAELMMSFYRHLKDGRSKDEALRAAQLELVRGDTGNFLSPHYWAAFQLSGDNARVRFE